MLTTGMAHQVLRIKYGSSTGTSVIIFFSGAHWVFTAKHIFAGAKPSEIEVFNENKWVKAAVSEYKESPTQDVSVLKAQINGMPNGNYFKLAGSMEIGQRLCFLGFPLSLYYTAASLFGSRAVPLYKEGVLSGLLGEDEEQIWVIDAMNNQGFSGGPVFSIPLNRNPNDISLIGIISSYIFRKSSIFTVSGSGPSVVENESSTQFVKENPGIMISSPIRFCLKLINPDWLNEAGKTPQLE